MEIKGRILNVEHKPYEWNGKTVDKWVVSVQVGNETKVFDCGFKAIANMSGKDLPEGTTMQPPKEGTNYNPKLVLPKDESRPFGSAQRSQGLTDRQAKVMVLSYSKDMAVAYAHTHKPEELADVAVKIYAKLWKAVE